MIQKSTRKKHAEKKLKEVIIKLNKETELRSRAEAQVT